MTDHVGKVQLKCMRDKPVAQSELQLVTRTVHVQRNRDLLLREPTSWSRRSHGAAATVLHHFAWGLHQDCLIFSYNRNCRLDVVHSICVGQLVLSKFRAAVREHRKHPPGCYKMTCPSAEDTISSTSPVLRLYSNCCLHSCQWNHQRHQVKSI